MDWDKRNSMRTSDSSRPQPRFVRNRRRPAYIPRQFGVAAIVFWAPLVVAFFVGFAIWLGLPPWSGLLLVVPAVAIGAIIQELSPLDRRVAVGMIVGVGVVLLVGVWYVCLEGELLRRERLANPETKRVWTGDPVIIAFACIVPVMLGAILGQCWAWKRGDT